MASRPRRYVLLYWSSSFSLVCCLVLFSGSAMEWYLPGRGRAAFFVAYTQTVDGGDQSGQSRARVCDLRRITGRRSGKNTVRVLSLVVRSVDNHPILFRACGRTFVCFSWLRSLRSSSVRLDGTCRLATRSSAFRHRSLFPLSSKYSRQMCYTKSKSVLQ
jgi:hypothetical protein